MPFENAPDAMADPVAPQQNVPDPAPLYQLLDEQGIRYQRYDHVPVFTCDQADGVVPENIGAIHSKNLFIRDKRGRRHWLLVTSCEKPVDLKAVASLLDADTLSLGSPDRLWNHLRVTPGSVTILALMHDTAHAVELVIDAEVWSGAPVRCHPLVNTSTLVLERDQLQRFLDHTGHRPRVIEVPARR